MINPNAYYSVQGWMLSELGLKGNALSVYAIVYGFSQDGVSEYAGSSAYLCEWLGCTKKTVLNTLAELTEKGYLEKKIIIQNGVKLCNYVAVRRPYNLQDQPGEEITPPRCKNYTTPGEEITPHNLLDNIEHNSKDIDIYSAPGNNEPQEPPKKRGRKKAETVQPPDKKREYGEYKHVKLTDAELAKLIKKHGEEKVAKLINYLDCYIEEKPAYKSQSHYLAIGRWVVDAVNEKERRTHPQSNQPRAAARGYGAPAANVGPNGIAIDPTKNDLDGIF